MRQRYLYLTYLIYFYYSLQTALSEVASLQVQLTSNLKIMLVRIHGFVIFDRSSLHLSCLLLIFNQL